MDAGEIKSPEVLPQTPVSLEANTESHRRKRLGMYFLESDDRRTALGGGYTTGGATPVNIRGKPLSELSMSKTGGWIAAFFIFGTLILCLFLFSSDCKLLGQRLETCIYFVVLV